jgi:hypothetical protein
MMPDYYHNGLLETSYGNITELKDRVAQLEKCLDWLATHYDSAITVENIEKAIKTQEEIKNRGDK